MKTHSIQTQLGNSGALDLSPFSNEDTDRMLESVSSDLSKWQIFESTGITRRDAQINLDIELADGSLLTDIQNRDLFIIAVEYLLLLKIYMPDATVNIYRQRISDLLTLFYWLSQRRVCSLQVVTRDHVELYTKTIAYGREWALEIPHQLVQYLKHCRVTGETLPKKKPTHTRILRSQLYQAAEIRCASGANLHICSHIVRRIEKIGLTEELNLPVRDLVGLCGYELRPHTYGRLSSLLKPLEDLWEWRNKFSKPTLIFHPYPRGTYMRATQLGRPEKRHKTIPPQIAIAYLSEALKWVIEFSPIILRGLTQNWDSPLFSKSLSEIGLKITVVNKKGRVISYRGGTVNRSGLFRLLGIACFIVIACFSARRRGEIMELGAGRCRQDSRGNYWLRTYIEKTHQQYDEIPVPSAVNTAIKCMETLSDTARKATSRDCIWQFQLPGDKKCCDIRPGNYLNIFRYFCPTLSETEWRFSSHQFRRFFAVVYFWWYEKGDVVALAHHLRHFELEMTKHYVTDIEFGKLWKDVQGEWQAKFVRDVVYGARSVGGKAGHRLNLHIRKLHQRFRKEVDVEKLDRVVARILRLANKLGATFKQHVWGTVCACPRKTSFVKHSNCKGVAATGPDFANATEELCGTCPFAIQTSSYIASAKSALMERRNLPSGLTQDSLIHKFAASSCTNLEKIIEKRRTLTAVVLGE